MTLKTLFVALAACTALPCAAKESTEVRDKAYVEKAYVEKAREVSGLIAIGWLCKQAGYTVAADIVPRTIEPIVFQAEKDGMSFSDATAIVAAANTTANEDEQAVTNRYVRSRDVKGWFAHVDGKCSAYAAQPAYAPYLKAPADPAAGRAAFSAWAASLSKGR